MLRRLSKKAFEYFNCFVDRNQELDGVLLEELEPRDNGWVVAIGFNGKRQKTSEPATVGAFGALAGFGNKTTTQFERCGISIWTTKAASRR